MRPYVLTPRAATRAALAWESREACQTQTAAGREQTIEIARRPAITERALRPVAQMEDVTDQKAKFQELADRC
jgi:hypothetical protein